VRRKRAGEGDERARWDGREEERETFGILFVSSFERVVA